MLETYKHTAIKTIKTLKSNSWFLPYVIVAWSLSMYLRSGAFFNLWSWNEGSMGLNLGNLRLLTHTLILSEFLSYGLALAGAAFMVQNTQPGIGRLLKRTVLTTLRFFAVWFLSRVPVLWPAFMLLGNELALQALYLVWGLVWQPLPEIVAYRSSLRQALLDWVELLRKHFILVSIPVIIFWPVFEVLYHGYLPTLWLRYIGYAFVPVIAVFATVFRMHLYLFCKSAAARWQQGF